MTNGCRLVISQGPQPGQTFSLDLDKETIVLGRDPRVDVVIDHPQISRRHARIIHRGQEMVLEDLGSTNGTFIDGRQLTSPHTLRHGDKIGLSETVTLIFETGETVAEQATVSSPPKEKAPPSPSPHPARQPARSPTYADSSPAAPPYSEQRPTENKRKVWLWLIGGGVLLLALICATAILIVRLMPDSLLQTLINLGIPVPAQLF